MARRVATFSVAANAVLAVANLVAGVHAGSAAARAAGVEFGADVITALFLYFGLWFASRPADSEHPYGHGRAETVTGLIIGVILALTGVALAVTSLWGLSSLQKTPPGVTALWTLGAALVVKGVLMTVKIGLGRRLGSRALEADGWNDSVDVLSALAATVALSLARLDPERFLMADQFGGFVVGLFVVMAGVTVAGQTSRELIDTMPPPPLMAEIRRVALALPGVRGVEKCFGRKTGLAYHVDLHLEVDATMSVREAHDIATDVRFAIVREVPQVTDVLVHVEPASGAAPIPETLTPRA
ncbi:MAG: cation diffusion facilitator family transporter [Luteitalea sp.]|nr:cation diffusion facilitator family transporter [Luteitalea sp.]